MFIVGQHQGAREYMEDTFVVDTNLYHDMKVYAVFDGHGGTYVSEFLKQHMLDVLKNVLSSRTNEIPSIEDCLYITIKRLQSMLEKDKCINVGSTCLIALRNKDMLYIANVGDCRAIINVKESALRVTHDHKPNTVSEFNRIREMGGFVTTYPNDAPRVNGMLAVSRSLGDLHLSPYVRWEPEVSTLQITDHNKIMVLASDGVWDTMSDQDVYDVIQETIHHFEKHEPQKSMQEVFKVCAQNCILVAQQRGSGDNITIICVGL